MFVFLDLTNLMTLYYRPTHSNEVCGSLCRLRSSFMNFLALWPPGCVWPGAVVVFGELAGANEVLGAARRFIVDSEFKLAEKKQKTKGSA